MSNCSCRVVISAYWTVSNYLNVLFHAIVAYDDSSLIKWLESCAGIKRTGVYFFRKCMVVPA
jgi:hypothetical protein